MRVSFDAALNVFQFARYSEGIKTIQILNKMFYKKWHHSKLHKTESRIK